MQRVAARMPMPPQIGHARSSGGGPKARISTIRAHATRSPSPGPALVSSLSIVETRVRRAATALSP
jgi:hypothetical protein